ncbi:hypothetical protein [Alkalibacillus silvisoli]|uniref:Fibronectin type-III domain-containing protein n=1 Tax=Alkalibacillus silvisoli TaxID=392823 RepID=A0ABN1AAZ1_9BACI
MKKKILITTLLFLLLIPLTINADEREYYIVFDEPISTEVYQEITINGSGEFYHLTAFDHDRIFSPYHSRDTPEELPYTTASMVSSFEYIKYFRIRGHENSNLNVTGVDVIPETNYTITTEEPQEKLNIKELQYITNTNSIELTYFIPEHDGFNYVQFYLNEEVYGITEEEKYSITDLEPNTSYEIGFKSVYEDGEETETETINVTTNEPELENVENISANENIGSIDLIYNLPTTNGFDHLEIYLNGELHTTTAEEEYSITGLEPSTSYEIGFKSVYEDGEETDLKTVDVTTNEPEVEPGQQEVQNLTADNSEEEKINLSWDNPEYYFDKAIIYRKTTSEGHEVSLNSLNFNLFQSYTVHADETGDDHEPIFETNGTEFSDLTVEEGNEYEYKVTTEYDGIESEGVYVQTTAPTPPIIDISDVSLPFGAEGLLDSSSSILKLIGGFVLLSLAIMFVPKIIRLIVEAAKKRNKNLRNTRVR